jgi:F0F1-type ATP synthase assembly protein I
MNTQKNNEQKTARTDIGSWIVYGLIIGTLFGIVFKQMVWGMILGICVGIIIGGLSSKKEK